MTRTQLFLEPRSAQCVLTRRNVLWHAPGSVFCVQFVELDVQDLGGHLDFTTRAGAGTLSKSVKDARHGVAAVGALHLRFPVQLGVVRGKHLPAGLHAFEASYVSPSSLSASCCLCEVGLVQ